MVSAQIKIRNEKGIHLRTAGVLCKEALRYSCQVSFKKKNYMANAKSVLSVLGACVKKNDEILLICNGENEKQVLETLSKLIESGMGEKLD